MTVILVSYYTSYYVIIIVSFTSCSISLLLVPFQVTTGAVHLSVGQAVNKIETCGISICCLKTDKAFISLVGKAKFDYAYLQLTNKIYIFYVQRKKKMCLIGVKFSFLKNYLISNCFLIGWKNFKFCSCLVSDIT